MSLNSLSQKLVVPGLEEAQEREQQVRTVAFFPITESIAGFEVLPMTIEHLNILIIANSPLLGVGIPSPLELIQFLWVLSTDYQTTEDAHRRFLHRCKVFMPPSEPLILTARAQAKYEERTKNALKKAAEIIEAARLYVSETFQDRPPKQGSAKDKQADYYSDACWLCASLAREYGWSEAAIWKMPLKRVFQYIKEITRFHDPTKPLFNPSDILKAQFADAETKGRANSRPAPVLPGSE